MKEVTQTPDAVNEVTIVGEFGFKRLAGPFSAEKTGTIWTVDIPEDFDQLSLIEPDDEGRGAVVIADGETCGGGIVDSVVDDLDDVAYRLLIDQYAMEDV